MSSHGSAASESGLEPGALPIVFMLLHLGYERSNNLSPAIVEGIQGSETFVETQETAQASKSP